ncbi:cytochrome P450 [Xylariaceae sp. FL0804]|nr:cytochrome P450 [Xylariaceae sp. FL0804]
MDGPFFRLSDMGGTHQLLTFVLGSVTFYLAFRTIWLLFFHPLSSYPGPKLAAVSDAWYAYNAFTGRWPWAVADAVRTYGDVVRIAPNELVFSTPKALADIYTSHNGYLETFTKTQINNHGNDRHGGIIWEWDPVRHRQVSKQLSPAFSGRALKAKEATLHKYVDLFVSRMRENGATEQGVSLNTWINWLCVDISADMAYNREMNALSHMQDPPYISILYGFSKAITVIQASWRFPLLAPLKYMFLVVTSMRPHSHIRDHSRAQLERRIRRRGAVDHLDFFEQIIPEDREPPSNRDEMRHLEQVAGQLLVAGYEPPSLWLYTTLYQLATNHKALEILTKEVRSSFRQYEDITAAEAAGLPYLTACLKESLRMMPGILTGMPVASPGAMVDGSFISKGVVCQSSPFALARDPRNFNEPLSYRPERWLSVEHPLYDAKFVRDNLKGFHPFNQGPRMCTGKEVAWWQSRVFVAKVLWVFEIEMVPGQQVDMDRDLRGWGLYHKPDVRVKFVLNRSDERWHDRS